MAPSRSGKRKASQSTLQPPQEKRARAISPIPTAIVDNLHKALSSLFEGKPDLTNPVINGATAQAQPKPFITNLVREIASQAGRLGENVSLTTSLIETPLFDGGYVDDKKYQMEKILQLAASLPAGTPALDNLTGRLIGLLWNNLEHPPLSYQGREFKYRTADGSNNNIMYPHLGKAGSYYARTICPQTLMPGVLPDPGLIFDTIFAREDEGRDHPNRISSMLFYIATIIIHDCFHTDERNPSKVRTSSYLDLAPLYGSSADDQKKVRSFKDGLLFADCFAESRLLGFPPAVSAIVVCFNRFHNYVAKQLKEINEGGRFKMPKDEHDVKAAVALDEDLFQTARLVTCGLYVNIILCDYVRTILNLNRSHSTWTLDPRSNCDDIFDSKGVPSGIGNQVSVEFNLLYRWHSAISKKDEKWTNELYQKIFGDVDTTKLSKEEIVRPLYTWLQSHGTDPRKWNLDDGKYKRNGIGCFKDEDLVNILSDATEDVAGAFGPRNVPVVMRLIEIMGMEQARSWNVATLNEFREFFKLTPHKTFADITSNEQVAQSLKTLYGHPDYVEMYVGLVAESPKDPMEPGSGLCPGFTISRAILADAVALTRGDRFYTVDYTAANLTNWGYNQVKPDPEVAQGGVFYNLLQRALPNWYRGNSVYAMYPLTVPDENHSIHEKLGVENQYYYERPSYIDMPKCVRTWDGVISVLKDTERFGVPWGPHTSYITGHEYMLSGDKPENVAQHHDIYEKLHCPAKGPEEVQKFYTALTTQLIHIHSQTLIGNTYQLDACRDVGNLSHTIFTAQLFHIPLKAKGDHNPAAVEVEQLHLAFSVLFAYVFLDLDAARSFKLRSGAKQAGDGLKKLLTIVCKAVKAGDWLHLRDLFSNDDSGRILADYGTNLIKRFLDGGKTIEEVVAEIIPTCAGSIATQSQAFAQMLDLYLSDEYKQYWPQIQAYAWSDKPEDFEKLKGYALEANRLAPAAFGLLRDVKADATIHDGDKNPAVSVKTGDKVYTDFVAAGLDENKFPNAREIIPDRDRSLYLHHGHGNHACIGRPFTEVAMAAQLKVFARLKNLRRAPGPQGEMKKTVPVPMPVSSNPKPGLGKVYVYMKEDWSDWWPFPTNLKIHHDGFSTPQDEFLGTETGIPDGEEQIADSDMVEASIQATNGVNGHGGDDGSI